MVQNPTLLIALYTGTSTPMVQNGQEFGEDYWLPENNEGTGRRVTPRPIRWKYVNDTIGKSLCKLCSRMAEVRKDYPALRRGSFDPDYWEEWQTQFNPAGYGLDTKRQLAVYRRSGRDENERMQYFVIVLNFSDSSQQVTTSFPENGLWTDLLANTTAVGNRKSRTIALPSAWALIGDMYFISPQSVLDRGWDSQSFDYKGGLILNISCEENHLHYQALSAAAAQSSPSGQKAK